MGSFLTKHWEKYPQVQSSTLPAFVDFLLERITELANRDAETNSKCNAQTMHNQLISLRSSLEDIVELSNDEEKSRSLWGRVSQVAYRVEDLMDCLLVGDRSDSISASLDRITKDISDIQSEIDVLKDSEIKVLKKSEIKVKEVTTTHSHVQSTTLSMTKGVVGFRDQTKSIVEILSRNEDKLLMVAIVGMPGLGKTTLAGKIYNSPYVKDSFPVCAWVVVSQTFDKKRVLIDILKQVSPVEYSRITSDSTVHDVANQLRRFLKEKKYLIVFDDIWEAKTWEDLQPSFPDGSKGSRILLTSRRHHEFVDETYPLQPLTEEESVEILQSQLISGDGSPIEVGNLKTQIVEICGGVPLIMVIVAGVIKSSQPNQWKEMLDGLSSGDLSKRCRDTVELSYRLLPEHLKPCFLYLAVYPEDERISVKKLLHKWMAEGFVRKSETKHLPKVAEEYLGDLIDRSLLLVDRRTFNGRVKACRIHDLLHDFCMQKTKDEQFFHFLEGGYDEQLAYNVPTYQWRLCIHTNSENFMKNEVDCSRVRSLRFKYSEERPLKKDIFSMRQIGKLIRVLDLEQIRVSRIPNEIGLFGRLIYLAVRGQMSHIPPSVGNLSTLETFVLTLDPISEEDLLLPDSFWNLQKLNHFLVVRDFGGRGCLPVENLESSSKLYELENLEGVIIPYQGMEDVVKKFPKVRKLNCKISGVGKDPGNPVEIGALALLTHLESLQMTVDCAKLIELSLAANLKKLSLVDICLSGRCLSNIGDKMPSLEVLRLNFIYFEGETWEMKEGEFTKIRFFEMNRPILSLWRGSDDQFGNLEKLSLTYCHELEEMPECLLYSSMLRTIEINECNKTVEEFVEKIKEEQEDNGNSDLTITVQKW